MLLFDLTRGLGGVPFPDTLDDAGLTRTSDLEEELPSGNSQVGRLGWQSISQPSLALDPVALLFMPNYMMIRSV